MEYTVSQLSKLAGVSVRTLHYYDQIGLLKPSHVKLNGYRAYGEKELIKLQQIMFFRELEFPLEEISTIVNAPKFNVVRALEDQEKLLLLKQKRLDVLLRTINTTLKHVRGGEALQTEDLYQGFPQAHIDQYKDEVKARWGHSAAYKQSMQRTKNWTKADYLRVAEEGMEINKELSKLMGREVSDPEVMSVIARHHQYIEQFYDCSYEMYEGLGKMYVDDPRFTAYYEKHKPGLAHFLKDAIQYYCQHNLSYDETKKKT